MRVPIVANDETAPIRVAGDLLRPCKASHSVAYRRTAWQVVAADRSWKYPTAAGGRVAAWLASRRSEPPLTRRRLNAPMYSAQL